jgi:hypothetical protein
MSQALMELGRLEEALHFDEKAMEEMQRCADSGDTFSQNELWIYRVNRGRLYLRLGRIDEAEKILQESIPHIHLRRRMYQMFAEDALDEIKLWRQQTTSSIYQLDWRWIERYRKLVSYDSYWWLTWAGPFTEDEQQQWDRLLISPVDDVAQELLAPLLKQSRERELEAALAERREPRLLYPAIEIDEVRQRIANLFQLDIEIGHEEPNAIVRRLYHGAIEEELDFLRVIEATYEKNPERFWEYMLRSFPIPTAEEMDYALARVKNMLVRGFDHPGTTEISQQLEEFIRTQLHLTFDLSSIENEQQQVLPHLTQSEREISARGTKRFFEAILRDCGYDSWSVIIDHNATNARIEQGLRRIFLPDQQFSLGEIRHLLSHELLGHVSRCVAGERSLVGLLGISTKNSASVEEGIALYHERQIASLHGQSFNDSGIANGTLATGLASGVMIPPQTFLSLCTFFELFSTLSRLLRYPDADLQEIQKEAREYALSMCLRTYRGVPDLKRAGICNLQDATHLHGLRLVEQAVAQDENVLDRLAVGVVSLELLSDLQELGIDSDSQPLRKLAYDPDLDSYILSFENKESKKKLI